MSNEVIYVTKDDISEHLNFMEGFERLEEVIGDNSISFTSYRATENHSYKLLEAESIINVNDYEYRIKEVTEYSNRKEVFAQNVFFDLITVRREEPFGGFYTFQQFLDFIFEGTGWTYGGDVEGQMVIDRFGRDNLIKLTDRLCEFFECEYEIRPNREVWFTKKIGADRDFQYRAGHNIVSMAKHYSTVNLRTAIRGFGADDLEVVYYSPNIDIFGELWADPVKDERFSIEENFFEYVKSHLIDYPEISVELDSYELLDRELGEDVWLIYEPLGIEFHTRVLAKTSTLRDGKLVTSSVVIGNVIPRDIGDVVGDLQEEVENQNEINTSRFDMTDSKIEMEVTRVKSYTDEQLGEVREEASSNFTILAGRIDAKADYTEVSALGTRVNSVEFSMNAMEGEISTKVSQSDYTGEVMVSKINQSPSSVKIQAKNITLAGAVTVLSELSGDMGNIYAGNISISQDMSIGNRLILGTNQGDSTNSILLGGLFGAATIYGSGTGNMRLSSSNTIELDTYVLDASKVNSVIGLIKSDTSGLSFGYNQSTKNLSVSLNGSYQGFIPLQ